MSHRKYTRIELSMIASYAATGGLTSHERCGPCDLCITQYLDGTKWRGDTGSEGFERCVSSSPAATPDEVASVLE